MIALLVCTLAFGGFFALLGVVGYRTGKGPTPEPMLPVTFIAVIMVAVAVALCFAEPADGVAMLLVTFSWYAGYLLARPWRCQIANPAQTQES